jgi:hypothetical protein
MRSLRAITLLALAPLAAVHGQQPQLNPAAAALFERDDVLRGWALRRYDRNGDGWLTSFEAQDAAAAFKQIADSNRDGRVTPYEYEQGKAFVAARWPAPVLPGDQPAIRWRADRPMTIWLARS